MKNNRIQILSQNSHSILSFHIPHLHLYINLIQWKYTQLCLHLHSFYFGRFNTLILYFTLYYHIYYFISIHRLVCVLYLHWYLQLYIISNLAFNNFILFTYYIKYFHIFCQVLWNLFIMIIILKFSLQMKTNKKTTFNFHNFCKYCGNFTPWLCWNICKINIQQYCTNITLA